MCITSRTDADQKPTSGSFVRTVNYFDGLLSVSMQWDIAIFAEAAVGFWREKDFWRGRKYIGE
jgi:hypothetical protein